MTQQHTYLAQRNVESDALFPSHSPVVLADSDPSEEEDHSIERGYDKVDTEAILSGMFAQYAASLHIKEHATPRPVYKEVLDDTGIAFTLKQVGEKPPAIYEMYDSLLLYTRASVINGVVAIRPELFTESVRTIDEYIEAYVRSEIERAVAERGSFLAYPPHISTGEVTPDDESNLRFVEIVKKITNKTLTAIGINSPLFHSAPTDIITKID